MSNKKIKEFKNLTKDELVVKVREVQASLFEARMKQKTGQLEDINTLWKLRKDVARMKTLLTQQVSSTAK